MCLVHLHLPTHSKVFGPLISTEYFSNRWMDDRWKKIGMYVPLLAYTNIRCTFFLCLGRKLFLARRQLNTLEYSWATEVTYLALLLIRPWKVSYSHLGVVSYQCQLSQVLGWIPDLFPYSSCIICFV